MSERHRGIQASPVALLGVVAAFHLHVSAQGPDRIEHGIE